MAFERDFNFSILITAEFLKKETWVDRKDNDNTILSLYIGDTMIGFITYEIISVEYAVCHFIKADGNYKGIYDMLIFVLGKELTINNIKYLNYEQDLGIEGLRRAKKRYKPEFYLNKFIFGTKN